MTGTAGTIRVLHTTPMDELGRQYVVTGVYEGVGEGHVLFKYPIRLAINPVVSRRSIAGLVVAKAGQLDRRAVWNGHVTARSRQPPKTATLDEFFHDSAAVSGGQINDSLVSFDFEYQATRGSDSL